MLLPSVWRRTTADRLVSCYVNSIVFDFAAVVRESLRSVAPICRILVPRTDGRCIIDVPETVDPSINDGGTAPLAAHSRRTIFVARRRLYIGSILVTVY